MNQEDDKRPETPDARDGRFEKACRTAAWILAVLLLLIQGALQSPDVRSWLTPADRLEGIPYSADPGR